MGKNSIKWNEWDESVFSKAREENKLILLSISAPWCYWCHVDDQAIKYINDNFVPIRIDMDKSLDADGRYNLSGWLSTAILSPNGQVIIRRTYISPEELLHMLKEANRLYREFNDEMPGRDNKKIEKKAIYVRAISKNVCNEIQAYILKSAMDMFDTKYGGFGKRPKFLYPELLSYLIGYFYATNDENIKRVIVKTMDIMYGSEVYDRVEGGFFRYAAERDFSNPNYEKLLDDNARLLSLYIEAYQVFNHPLYMRVAEDILNYIEKYLYDSKKGLFYGGQIAGQEYYKADKIKRGKLKKPSIDKTFYADKNSLAAVSILKYYSITGKSEYMKIAKRIADKLLEKFMDKKGLIKHHPESKEANILEDQVYAADLFTNLYSITGDKTYLDESMKLVDRVIDVFYDDRDRGFLDFLPIEGIKYDQISKSLPVNSEMALLCLKLYTFSNNRVYHRKSEETLLYFSRIYREYGIFASSYSSAVKAFVDGIYKFTLVGKRDDIQTKDLFKDLRTLYFPDGILEILDTVRRKEEIVKRGYTIDETPHIYICIGNKCLPPVNNGEDLNNFLKSLQTREEVK